MAIISMKHYSNSIGKRQNVTMYVPETKAGTSKVLYLLHGLSDDNDLWFYNSRALKYFDGRNVTVICPDCAKHFYTNGKSEYNYYDYISKELPEFIKKVFSISDKREDNYIMGLSMGGYGALKIALSNPDNYCGAASFSGVTDIQQFIDNDPKKFDAIFDGTLPDDCNLFKLADKANKGALKPKIYQWCGTEDFLYQGNIKFRDYIKKLDFDYTYNEYHGDHDWKYWDEQLLYALDFFEIL